MTGLPLLLAALSTSGALAADTHVGTVYTALSTADVQGLLDAMMLSNTPVPPGDAGPGWQLTLGDAAAVLFLDDCDGGACSSVQLWAGFSASGELPPGLLNSWNRDHRFTRAYVDDDGLIHLETDLDLSGGVALDAVIELMRTFRASALAFSEHLSTPAGDP